MNERNRYNDVALVQSSPVKDDDKVPFARSAKRGTRRYQRCSLVNRSLQICARYIVESSRYVVFSTSIN